MKKTLGIIIDEHIGPNMMKERQKHRLWAALHDHVSEVVSEIEVSRSAPPIDAAEDAIRQMPGIDKLETPTAAIAVKIGGIEYHYDNGLVAKALTHYFATVPEPIVREYDCDCVDCRQDRMKEGADTGSMYPETVNAAYGKLGADMSNQPSPVNFDYLGAALKFSQELSKARAKFGPMASAHEGYAVMLEEMDELKAIVWQKQSERDYSALRKETIQLGAMVLAFLIEVVETENRR